eukprot:snap_masked-scaffold_7-processed-gene-12.14-mRNA-1 protein AED:1.00 eAED:1.00 QI:0/0/0/0/1/1/2/0/100
MEENKVAIKLHDPDNETIIFSKAIVERNMSCSCNGGKNDFEKNEFLKFTVYIINFSTKYGKDKSAELPTGLYSSSNKNYVISFSSISALHREIKASMLIP